MGKQWQDNLDKNIRLGIDNCLDFCVVYKEKICHSSVGASFFGAMCDNEYEP